MVPRLEFSVLSGIGSFLFIVTGASGQSSTDPVFRATTKLVQVSVIAQDRDGTPVADLRREDFQVFDNGSPQEVRVFVAEKPAPSQPELRPPNTFTNQIAAGQTDSAATGRSGYSVILFDNLATQFGDPLTGKEGTGFGVERVLRMIQTMPEGEKIALYTIGRRLQVVREFTTDRASLEQRLRAWKTSIDTPDLNNCAPDEGAGGPQRPDRYLPLAPEITVARERAVAECNRLDMAGRLGTFEEQLKQIADHLAGVPGRKNLIWMANRFPIAGGHAVQRLMNAGVAIYPVDENGVYNPSPDQKQMQALAAMTGGVAYALRNDLDLAVREAIDDS